jgi:hypothetical protein
VKVAEIPQGEAGTGIRVRRPAPPNTCGGCDATWTGDGRAHCSACHRTFAGVGLFDRHRSMAGERGACADPAALRHGETGEPVMFLRHGMWCGPEMTDEQKAAAFGGRAA